MDGNFKRVRVHDDDDDDDSGGEESACAAKNTVNRIVECGAILQRRENQCLLYLYYAYRYIH